MRNSERITFTRDFSFVKLTSNSANRARAPATSCRNCSNFGLVLLKRGRRESET